MERIREKADARSGLNGHSEGMKVATRDALLCDSCFGHVVAPVEACIHWDTIALECQVDLAQQERRRSSDIGQ